MGKVDRLESFNDGLAHDGAFADVFVESHDDVSVIQGRIQQSDLASGPNFFLGGIFLLDHHMRASETPRDVKPVVFFGGVKKERKAIVLLRAFAKEDLGSMVIHDVGQRITR